jgi:uncharacterized protein (DUF3820 family)
MPSYTEIEFEDDDDEVSELEEAMETVLRFGKHKGRALKDIVKSREGRSYLKWLSETDGEKWAHTRHKCKIVLAFAAEAIKAKGPGKNWNKLE